MIVALEWNELMVIIAGLTIFLLYLKPLAGYSASSNGKAWFYNNLLIYFVIFVCLIDTETNPKYALAW